MRPFELDVPETELEQLRARLRTTRFPDPETVDDWSQGLPLATARELRDHWLHRYDWRTVEAELNAAGQHLVELDGTDIHLLHVRSPEPGATPLLLTHGWPGSVVEFLDVLQPLTDPVAHGGERADAFHVVAPSLPGYGFSGTPAAPGWGIERIAAAWVELMGLLGYGPFVAQGGDWGAMVATSIALQHPEALSGLHLNMPLAPPVEDGPDEQEQAAEDRYQQFRARETGYAWQQSTRPQTLGYGLADSPMGQAAWIVEKFHAWTDNDGDLPDRPGVDRLLDNVMLYWLGNNGASSARLYWESYRDPDLRPVDVPTGVSVFPEEIVPAPRRWVEARFTDLRAYTEHDVGGHFAALEQPEALVDDVRAFARAL